MDRYTLFNLGFILLFGFAGGLLFYGRRGLLPGRDAGKRGVFLAGGVLCLIAAFLRADSPGAFRPCEPEPLVSPAAFVYIHYSFWPRLIMILFPLAVLALAAGLLYWRGQLLAQAGNTRLHRLYHVMWWLCVGGCAVLFLWETDLLLRELLL